MKLLDAQRYLFTTFSAIATILFVAQLFTFPLLDILRTVSFILLLGIFVYGLTKKKKWAFHYGFLIISFLIISTIAWQVAFKTIILPTIRHLSYTLVNVIAVFNVLSVTFFLIVLILSLYIQVRLKNVLKK